MIPPEKIIQHALDVKHAQADYPGLDITDAYERYMAAHGKKPFYLSSRDQAAMDCEMKKYTSRPCPDLKCSGVIVLEPVCPSCVEGKAGFQSKWTCNTCLTRFLSALDYSDWFLDPPPQISTCRKAK